MKPTKQNLMLFNGAAALLVGASLVYVVRSMVFSESIPPCSERYPRGVQMALESGGQPVATADLQARAAGSDWSLLERTQVVKVAAGPAKVAMQFDLAAPGAANSTREGAGFLWGPRAMKATTAACLAYSVYLPEGFQFGGGGRLPGLTGVVEPADGAEPAEASGPDQQQPATATSFSASPGWKKGGIGEVATLGPNLTALMRGGYSRIELPRGKWVRLEQEVKLNAPGAHDGILRLWLDGELVLDGELTNTQKTAAITGVVSEVVLPGQPVDPKAKDQKVSISPYIVYWK